MKILYRFATRSRPHKFFTALDNMFKMMQHDDFVISVTADIDDPTMFNDEVKERVYTYKNTLLWYGTSKTKVNAINRDTAFTEDWDILVNMSDDMKFIMHGFDKQIIRDYQTTTGDILMHYQIKKHRLL